MFLKIKFMRNELMSVQIENHLNNHPAKYSFDLELSLYVIHQLLQHTLNGISTKIRNFCFNAMILRCGLINIRNDYITRIANRIFFIYINYC